MKSLSDEELLYVLRNGIYAILEEDDEKLTHYAVIDFDDYSDELLVSFCGLDWNSNESSYYPHIIKGKDKNKKWFMKK